MGCLWKLAADFRYGADGSCKGASVVVVIEPVQQGAVLAHQGRLGGGGTGVNAQVAVALIGGKVPGLNVVAGMAS